MSHDLLLNLKDLACGYASQKVVQDLDLHLNAGDIGCLLGPSGCGKTTTLRAIAGFEPVLAGQIELGGEVISRPGFTLAPEKRRIGMVFQDYALFPHLSVADNVGFGIRKHPQRERLVRELLELVKLDHLAARHPHELSGGQQQRVALARALAPEPLLLLLDEPFSNLDVELRRSLSQEVREILKARGTSAILVTHDQEEAFAVCDHIGVFKEGHLEQWDTPYNLYHEPLTPFVASFVGQGYFIRGSCSARYGADRTRRDPRQSRLQPAFRQRGRRPAAPGRPGARAAGRAEGADRRQDLPRRRHPVPPAIAHRYPAGIDLPQPCRPPAGR